MLRGFVFDMDGVVIDSHPAHRAAWKAFLEALGKTVADSELDIILDGGKREEILKHFLGDLSPQQIVEYGARKDEILRNRSTRLEPMAGVVEGFRWALLGQSSGPAALVWVSVIVVLLLFVGGLFYFRRMESTFADIA